MKQNFTELQYVQMAKDRFCKIVNEIPFVSDVETSAVDTRDGFGDFHVIVHFADNERPISFLIEVKSNGERRFVNAYMQKAAAFTGADCPVFMAPYISDESGKAMKEKQCSYMDLSGNCYILTQRIFVYISGKANEFIIKKEKKNYFSKTAGAASAIMRTMLNTPGKQWQIITLAQESGKAVGTVSNVRAFLRDRDCIRDEYSGFRLQNVRELLYAWARDYHKKDARSHEFYSLEAIPELEQEISRWSITHDNGAVLGGFSAAARYAPTVQYRKLNVYVEPQFFNEFVVDLDLVSVDAGGNVVVTIPHDETPCMYARLIHGTYVTSPVQTVLDLLGYAGRGEEAADAIIAKEY